MPEIEPDPNAPSCRLYALLAREAPVGVIFRRGPSKMVRLILWNTEDDTFSPGQWFHGLISDYDLTPNGRYLVYYAGKYTGSNTGNHHEVPIVRSWTAVSRPPYLTALALWQSTYGGRWEGNRDLRLNISHNEGETHPDFPLSPDIRLVTGLLPQNAKNDVVVGQSGLLRGWQLDQLQRKADTPVHVQPRIWNKEDKAKGYCLRRTIPGEGSKTPRNLFQERFSLLHIASRTECPFPEGTCWADWDSQDRLVWALQGKLWTTKLLLDRNTDLFDGATLLADFTDMVWEDVPAPDWAKDW